jgi:hypothetical protein
VISEKGNLVVTDLTWILLNVQKVAPYSRVGQLIKKFPAMMEP